MGGQLKHAEAENPFWLQICDVVCISWTVLFTFIFDIYSPLNRISTGGQLKHAAAKKGPGSAAGRRTAAVLTESGERRAGKIRVLIAEDNAINMKVARGILDRMGYKQARAHPRWLCAVRVFRVLSRVSAGRAPPADPSQGFLSQEVKGLRRLTAASSSA